MTGTQPQDLRGEATDMMIAPTTIVVEIGTVIGGMTTIIGVLGTRAVDMTMTASVGTRRILSRDGVKGHRKILTTIVHLIKNEAMTNPARLIRNVLRMTAVPQTRNVAMTNTALQIRVVLRMTAALQIKSVVMRTTTANQIKSVMKMIIRSPEVKMTASVHLTTHLNVSTRNHQEDKRNLKRNVNRSKT
jgi:hypothetical protein